MSNANSRRNRDLKYSARSRQHRARFDVIHGEDDEVLEVELFELLAYPMIGVFQFHFARRAPLDELKKPGYQCGIDLFDLRKIDPDVSLDLPYPVLAGAGEHLWLFASVCMYGDGHQIILAGDGERPIVYLGHEDPSCMKCDPFYTSQSLAAHLGFSRP